MPLREQIIDGYQGLDVWFPDDTEETRWIATNVPARMQGWSFATNPYRENLGLCMTLATWAKTLESPLGVILRGPAGTGKTGAMVSALRELSNQRVGNGACWQMATRPETIEARAKRDRPGWPNPVWFETWRGLRDRLFREDRKVREPWLFQLEQVVAVLGLDDIDSDGRSRWKADKLLELVERPYNGLGLIITTNQPVERWDREFGERVADRMADPSAFLNLEFTGETRRRTDQQQP